MGRQNSGFTSEDRFLCAVRGRLESVRAPESLRARIGAMLAAEKAGLIDREPEDDWPR